MTQQNKYELIVSGNGEIDHTTLPSTDKLLPQPSYSLKPKYINIWVSGENFCVVI